MESETVKVLRSHLAALQAREAEVRAQLGPILAEIDQTQMALRAVTGRVIPASGAKSTDAALAYHRRKANPDIQEMTFKELVVKALEEHFQNGATAIEMLDFFKREWGREIMRTSLSPQLSRLKDEGKITRHGRTWYRIYEDDPRDPDLMREAILEAEAEALNENGEAEASPETDEVAASSDVEPWSSDQPSGAAQTP